MATSDNSYTNDDFDSSATSEATLDTASSRSSSESYGRKITGEYSLQRSVDKPKGEDSSRGFAGGIPPNRKSIASLTGSEDSAKVTSSTVRDKAFSGWLTRKEKMKKDAKSSQQSDQTPASLGPAKDEAYRVKCEDAVKEWRKRKSEAEKKKLKEEQERKEKEERETNERKERLTSTGNTLMNAWKESKEKALKEEHKKKLLLEEQEKRRKEEAIENEKASKDSFDSWKKKKDEELKEYYQKKQVAANEEKRKLKEKEFQRDKDNNDAINSWKKTKPVPIAARHPQPSSPSADDRPSWKPARSVQYEYPRHHKDIDEDCKTKTTHKQQQQQHRFVRTPGPSTPRTRVTNSGSRLKKKTVHVCCQVLEYWCSCDDDD